MCSHRMLVALLLAGPVPLAGQSVADIQRGQDAEVVRLERSRDSLLVLWREARNLEALQDSLTHVASVGRLDTLDVGAIRIVSNRSRLPLREAAEAYWPVFDSVYGVEAQRVREHPLLIQAIRADTGRQPQPWGLQVDQETSVEGLMQVFKTSLTVGRIDSTLRNWLPGEVRPPMFGLEAEARQAYVSLVTSPYRVGRDCFSGKPGSCRAALRLDDLDSEKLLSAYSAAERRQMVRTQENVFRHKRNLAGMVECRGGSDTACTEMLRSMEPARLPQPLLAASHHLLVHLALRNGGREAYQRLIADSASSLAHRLEYAAGLPLDSLIAQWHNAILAGRPKPVSLPVPEALAGVAWIALMSYLGLRSSRWRLG